MEDPHRGHPRRDVTLRICGRTFQTPATPESPRRRRTVAAQVPLSVRYLLAGLAIGGFWMSSDGPVWEHALRLAIVLVVVAPLIHLIRLRLAKKRPQPPRPQMSLLRLVVGKAILVAIAIIGTLLLTPLIAHPERVIGLALAATVATLGPLLHRHMVIAPPPLPNTS